jgi:serine/threonine protein kinase/tetratricopeptide (TPR) repeat protein
MSKPADAKAVFQDVRDLPTEEQAAFLDAACGGDPRLRARVEALLAADERAGPFLASPTGGGADDSAPHEQPGTVIGHFKLHEQIGEGGFGTVWKAEQQQPVRRHVALKVIKRGMDTRSVVARFEQERQALAMMDHPNIAKVFDGGETSAGRPYFAMELVRGVPITEFCDQRQIDARERLVLFVLVCQAVQHAHQKGIIHRDIKPSNVLVTLHDSVPVPKVIDFGIAKAVHQPLTEKTLVTDFRQMVGTPAYMAPEQAELSGLDIDTRADIYSLGVLLYELLTGTLPFDTSTLAQKGLVEMLRTIREDEPQKPSTRVATPSANGTEVARRRRTDTRRLGKLLRGDLDWIVMKALEKDRGRRYVSADAFAADVQRHLRDEPVLASPPGRAYRLCKYVRRHRVGVTAGGAVATALLAGLSAAVWGYVEARVERDNAVAATSVAKAQTDIAIEAKAAAEAEREKAAAAQVRAEEAQAEEARQRGVAEQQRVEAESQGKIAAAQRDKAERIAKFMSETLEGAGPSIACGRDITLLREMMDTAAARIEKGELKDAPEAELQLRGTIGKTYCELAAYDRASAMLEPALGLARSLHEGDAEATAGALDNLAHLRQTCGDLPGAEELWSEALEMARCLHPDDDPTLAILIDNLSMVLMLRGDLRRAEQLGDEALAMKRRLFDDNHDSVANSLNNLGMLLIELGDPAGAERHFREALEIYEHLYTGDHPSIAIGLNNLVFLLQARGDLAAAEPLCRDALEMVERLYPGDSPQLACGLGTSASLLKARGDLAGAEARYREALDMWKRLFEGDHEDVAVGLTNVASTLSARGDLEGAEAHYREALDMSQRLFPGDNPHVAAGLSNLASVLHARGDLAGAESQCRAALQMRQRLFVSDHPKVAISLNNLAGILKDRGDFVGAELLHREALAMRQRLFAGDHPDIANSLTNLAGILADRRDLAGAELMYREALDMWRSLFPGDKAEVATCLYSFATLLKDRGELAEAETRQREALAMSRRLFPADDPIVTDRMHALALVLKARGDMAGAETQFREALAARKRFSPNGDVDVAQSLNSLAVLLKAGGDLAGAEPYARESLELRRRLFVGDHARVASSIVLLADLLRARDDLMGAEELFREGAAMYDRLLGAGDLEAGRARFNLGLTLGRLQRFEEAETELLAGEQVLSKAERVPASLYKSCLEALVKFYESWDRAEPGKGHGDKSTPWKAQLERAQ